MSVYLDIEKQLGDFRLSAEFETGNDVLALLGASGCGKSMTLKCIAGIEKPDRGRIVVDSRTLFDSKERVNLSPQRRCVGLMFQNYALFPNMTVRGNILAGTRRGRLGAGASQRADEIMERFRVSSLASLYPSQLSGGQQQRVALARLLVSSPRILLLDEPFSALDSHLRFRLERELREVMREFEGTVILVSHDRDEVFRLADKIAVMNDGQIEDFGSRKRVFSSPATRNAAVLTGCKNISAIERLEENRVLALDWGIELKTQSSVSDTKYVGIRMHDIAEGEGENSFLCDVTEEIENPFSFTVMLRPSECPNASPIGWEMDKDKWRTLRGQRVRIHFPMESIVLLRG